MKIETRYICEICKSAYHSQSAAIACEDKGVANPADIPIGLMYEYHHNDFIGIFCFSKVEIASNPHYLNTTHWAFRVPGYPLKTIGAQYCGGHSHTSVTGTDADQFKQMHLITEEKIGCVEYKLMVKYLRSVGIAPCYYNERAELIKL